MTPVKAALVHINASLPMQIDESTFVACVKGSCTEEKWKAHMLSFFLETPVYLIHEIVLAGAVTFEALMEAQRQWNTEDYADESTTRWIQEMAHLSLGRAAALGIARFI